MKQKIKATWRDNNLVFTHFVVKQESPFMYSVYRCALHGVPYGEIITSGETMAQAAKKAKLLEMGYQICLESL